MSFLGKAGLPVNSGGSVFGGKNTTATGLGIPVVEWRTVELAVWPNLLHVRYKCGEPAGGAVE